MQDLIAFWHQHWDSIVHYAGVIIPWVVEVKLRLLGILLSWPAVTLYLGLLAMFLFRIPLTEWIGKLIIEGEIGGAKIRASSAQQVITTDPTAIEKAIEVVSAKGEAKGAATAAGKTQTIKPEGFDTAAIGQVAVTEVPNETQQLRNRLDIASRWLGFERTLNLIFGSQLALLDALRARPDGIFGYPEVSSFYGMHEHRMKTIGTPAPFETWLGWLINNGLVTSNWKLHPRGHEFLDYIDRVYPYMRPVRIG